MVISALQQDQATASYTITYSLTVNVGHKATSGRSIESLAEDIADALIDDDYATFFEDFPQVSEIKINKEKIELN